MKFRRMLLRYKRLTEEELQQIEADAKKGEINFPAKRNNIGAYCIYSF